jgi:hypothetical protein
MPSAYNNIVISISLAVFKTDFLSELSKAFTAVVKNQ